MLENSGILTAFATLRVIPVLPWFVGLLQQKFKDNVIELYLTS